MTITEHVRGLMRRGAEQNTVSAFFWQAQEQVDQRTRGRPHLAVELRRVVDLALREVDRWLPWSASAWRAHVGELLDRVVLREGLGGPLNVPTRAEVLLELLEVGLEERAHAIAATRISLAVLGEPSLDGVSWTWEDIRQAEEVVRVYRAIFIREGRA